MARRSKKNKAEAAAAAAAPSQPGAPAPSQSSAPAPPYGGLQLQVFDGGGHPAIMTFTRDSSGRVVQRLKRTRDFRAHLPQTRR
jgi:hypothetical protein